MKFADLASMAIQQFMMQRQKYSKTAVYIAMVIGAASIADNGLVLNFTIGGGL